MKTLSVNPNPSCGACKDGVAAPFAFSMAFQPIVDVVARRAFAYEALVRGADGASAASVLARVTPENQYQFDQNCRVAAIRLASRLGLAKTGAALAINFLPGAVYSPGACIQLTLKTAREEKFPLDQLVFEITEAEKVKDREHLSRIATEYRKHGFRLALDDFGAGYAGLNLMADVHAEVVKLDMELVRNVHQRPVALAIIRSMVALCETLRKELIAEGIESMEEYRTLRGCGIRLFQGYLLAKPEFESLPEFRIPEETTACARGVAKTGLIPPGAGPATPLTIVRAG